MVTAKRVERPRRNPIRLLRRNSPAIDRHGMPNEPAQAAGSPELTARVLLTGAGNAPSNNLVRSLRHASEPPFIAGCHDDRFVLRNSAADRSYLVQPAGS